MNKRMLTFLLFMIFTICAFYFLALQKTLFDIGLTYKLTGSQKGNLVTVSSLGYIAANLVGGYLSESLGKKQVILAGLLLSTAGAFLFAHISSLKITPYSYYLALLLVFFIGAGSGVMDGISNALIIDLHPERKAIYLNLSHAFFAIGAVGGPVIAGYLMQLFNWQSVYYFLGLVSLLFLFPFAFQRCPSPKKGKEKINIKAIEHLLKNRIFLSLNLCMLLYVGAEIGLGSWLCEYLRVSEYFRLSQMESGIFLSYFWIAMLIGRFIYGSLVERSSYTLALSISSVGGIICILAFLLTRQLTLAAVSIFLYGLFLSGMFATIISLGGEKFSRYSGATSGILVASGGIGGAIFPNLIGRISDIEALGLRVGFGVCILCLVGILVIVLSISRLEQKS